MLIYYSLLPILLDVRFRGDKREFGGGVGVEAKDLWLIVFKWLIGRMMKIQIKKNGRCWWKHKGMDETRRNFRIKKNKSIKKKMRFIKKKVAIKKKKMKFRRMPEIYKV